MSHPSLRHRLPPQYTFKETEKQKSEKHLFSYFYFKASRKLGKDELR